MTILKKDLENLEKLFFYLEKLLFNNFLLKELGWSEIKKGTI